MMTVVNPHPHLEVLVGIPGSGKTTFAAHRRSHTPALHIVSTDVIREQLYPGYEEGRIRHHFIDHRLIFRLAYHELSDALQQGHDVLFDATSLTVRRRHKLILLGRRYGAMIIAHYFPIPLGVAFHRNRGRARQVPRGAMMQMAGLLEPPTTAEGFDRVIVHRHTGR